MKVTNVQFLLQYMSINPGSTYTQMTKALCAWKRVPWHRGMYCRYFSNYQHYTWNPNGDNWPCTIYPGRLWEKYEGKWYLTPRGQAQLVQSQKS